MQHKEDMKNALYFALEIKTFMLKNAAELFQVIP